MAHQCVPLKIVNRFQVSAVVGGLGFGQNSCICTASSFVLPAAENTKNMQHHHSVDASGVFSGPVGADLRAKLASDENVLAALQVDLSADLRFVSGWVVVTSRRLLACDPGATVWRDWALAPGLALKLQDHGGVGTLELHNPQERVAFGALPSATIPRRCAWCSALSSRSSGCRSSCHRGRRARLPRLPYPPAARHGRMPRLRPRPGAPDLHLGAAAPVAVCPPLPQATGGGLCPHHGVHGRHAGAPYLTIPLMDDILIPYQNGQTIDPWLVLTYLGGLLLAALAAWGLSWARTYILALVSERIGADLRTTTYEHLLRLSLDYFGGKRTGDLMARIGSKPTGSTSSCRCTRSISSPTCS